MGTSRCFRYATLLLAFAAAPTVFVTVPGTAARAATTVTYSFQGDEDGEYPSTDLVRDALGNLYGTTVQGGEFGGGTVFQLSRSGAAWTHTVLYNFTGGADGGQPYGGVTLDDQGNLYGTAVVGGTGGTCVEDGCGVAYKLTNSGGTWTQTVIHNFTGGDDGYGPGAGLAIDAQGNLYGMTPTGGAYGLGTVYQLAPTSGGDYQLTVIHAFTGGSDGGAGSAGRFLLDNAGRLYGVATIGGAHGQGVVFRLAPTQSGWDFTTLYAFEGQPDAGFPYGGLAADQSGNLYGTTYYEGANDLGAVYRLSLRNGTWRETVLYSFRGGTDGASPISNVIPDAVGNLYGTTSEGGAPGCGCGTVFRLSPVGGGRWAERVVHRFQDVPDGAFPYNGMVTDGAGNFFGATVHGGADGEGAIYRFAATDEPSDVTKDDARPETIDAVRPAPDRAILLAGFPNPHPGGGAAVHYVLPRAGRVRVAVYGVDGRLVRILDDAVESEGPHDLVWDGMTDRGVLASRGAYVCEMVYAGERQRVRLTSWR